VRDTVRAYFLLMQCGEPGEVYNVGSGTPRGVRELLDVLLSFIDVAVEIQVDADRLRPSDVPVSYCDCTKLHAATAWEPSITFEEGLKYTLDYWRDRVKKNVEDQCLL
jgi:GDP-4-dehydro-6-deoxy-D-mannose reductase